MIDPGTITAIATTFGVTATASYGFFRIFNSKADKEDYIKSKETVFKMMNADRAEVASLTTNVAVIATDFKHMTEAMKRVDKNVEELLRNGKVPPPKE